MKILFVCKYKTNFQDNIVPFNRELVLSLRERGIQVDLFTIKGNKWSYLKNIFKVNQVIKNFDYDLVHAIFGLSGLVVNFQRKTPVIVSFIGLDINRRIVRTLSKNFTIPRSKASIFVSQKLYQKAGKPINGNVIPFGVALGKSFPVDKTEGRRKLGLDENKKLILFSSRFDRYEKNANLAFEGIKKSKYPECELVELKDIPDEELNYLMNACDICLMTSLYEGSPQFIKEAMACNKPVISTNVGDVKWVFGKTKGCYITDFDPNDLADKINDAFDYVAKQKHTNGKQRIIDLQIDKEASVNKIIDLYKNVTGNLTK